MFTTILPKINLLSLSLFHSPTCLFLSLLIFLSYSVSRYLSTYALKMFLCSIASFLQISDAMDFSLRSGQNAPHWLKPNKVWHLPCLLSLVVSQLSIGHRGIPLSRLIITAIWLTIQSEVKRTITDKYSDHREDQTGEVVTWSALYVQVLAFGASF